MSYYEETLRKRHWKDNSICVKNILTTCSRKEQMPEVLQCQVTSSTGRGWQTRWCESQINWGRTSNRSFREGPIFQVSTRSSQHPSLRNLGRRILQPLGLEPGWRAARRNLPWQEQQEMQDWPRRYFPYSSKRTRHGEATGSTDCLLCSSSVSPSIFNCLVEAFRKSNIKEKRM